MPFEGLELVSPPITYASGARQLLVAELLGFLKARCRIGSVTWLHSLSLDGCSGVST